MHNILNWASLCRSTMLVMVIVVVMVMRMTTKDEAVQRDWPAMPLVMEYGRMTHRQRNALNTQCVIDTHRA